MTPSTETLTNDSTNAVSPTAPATSLKAIKQSAITQTVFDLNTFDEVLLVKNVPDFIPAENMAEVLVRVGNDSAKVLELVNAGLKSNERAAIETNPQIPWHTFVLDAEGEPTKEINGVFTGTPADFDKVNSLRLTLAKTVFGYSKSMSKAEKSAAKDSAMEMIKTTPAIKAGLQKSAPVNVSVPVPVQTPAETPAA
jgi:hypothetical protein